MKIRYNKTRIKNRYEVVNDENGKILGIVWRTKYEPFSKVPCGWLNSGRGTLTGSLYPTRKLAAEALMK